MKKIFLYIMFAAVGLGLQSCLHDDDEIFDKSAAERIDDVINEASELLEGAQYGWAFHYYMGVDYAFGSFVMTAEFKNGKVTLKQQGYTQNDGTYVAETSTYKMSRDQGPVLSFDTYNDILHYYGDPAGTNAPTDVDGYEADFEFVIMDISADKNTIRLKGKKFGNLMTLKRLQQPSQDYLDDVEIVSENMPAQYSALKYVDGAVTAKFYFGASAFTVNYTDANGDLEVLNVPYTFTNSGVLFNAPIELGDNLVEGIEFVDGVETLPLTDSKNQTVSVSYDAVDIFLAGNWYLAYSNLGPVCQAGFKGFTDACMSEERETVQWSYIGILNGNYGFCFNSGGYAGVELFDYVAEGEDIITFSFAGSYSNGSYYRAYCNLASATEPFYTTFKLVKDDEKNPSSFTLQDQNNPENVIKLVKEVITVPISK